MQILPGALTSTFIFKLYTKIDCPQFIRIYLYIIIFVYLTKRD